MSYLKDFVQKPLLIKVVGQDGLFACTLESIDEHGIWVTGPELLRSLGGLTGTVPACVPVVCEHPVPSRSRRSSSAQSL
jgi:hypothetical protein